ncbi:ABC transporter permease [Dactylosporangium sp. NPDC051541]|uniref:ABC transporter permease n=1 Tax=Dactylosporangium sp. NPDC051541 TaxID=3363977 RepID=UPI0037B53C1B
MTSTFKYEFRMQIRKRSVWIVPALSVLLFILIGGSLLRDLFDPAERPPAARTAVIGLALQIHALLTIGYGCLLADRLVRDDRLRVAPILDATPAHPWGRLVGKYLGAAAATAIPVFVVYLGFTAAYAVNTGAPAALGWALAAIGVVMVPGLLFVAAVALAVPLTMPAPLFRVLFVGYWLWGNLAAPEMMPTLAGTLIHPLGGYPMAGLLDFHGIEGDQALAGPVPGAVFNFLRPDPTPATAWLSIGVLLAIAAATLAGGAALRARRIR